MGLPITSDRNTASKERISYARALIEVDVSKDLVREVSFMMPCGKIRHQQVVYDYEAKYYSFCKSFGHGLSGCKANNQEPLSQSAPKETPEAPPEG